MAKQETITEHRLHESDTGSPEVQIALLSKRISHLTEHLKTHPKDGTGAADTGGRDCIALCLCKRLPGV